MGTSRVRGLWACAVASLVAACATILDFPDRSLDDGTDGGPDNGDAADVVVDRGPQSASFSSSAVDFGLMPCGATESATYKLTITNNGSAPLAWAATLSATTVFALEGSAVGTIPGGSSADVVVTSLPVPAVANAGETAKAVLAIATDDPQHASTIFTVGRTAGGATLTIVPATADFGDTPPLIYAGDIPIALTNVGNQPVNVSFGAIADPSFSINCGGGACAGNAVAPDASLSGLVARFRPPDAGDYNSTTTLTLTGAMCGTNPSLITLTGKGAGSIASVQPGSLDFGMVDCGGQAAAKVFKVINTAPGGGPSLNWVLQALPTYYSVTIGANDVVAGAPNAVAAASSMVVTVTPKPVPADSAVTANLFGETLTITTDAPGDTDPHTLQLLETPHGAILAQSAATVAFGSVLIAGGPATFPVTVSNIGNAAATVSYSVSDPSFAMAPMNQNIGGGGSYVSTASFDPTAATSYAGTAQLTVAAGAVLCKPIPPAIALSGSGALSASVTSSVDFGLVNCNTTAGAQNVTLKNTGSAAFTWTAALAKGTMYYNINPSSGGSLPPGMTTTITVTPKQIPANSLTTPDGFADTLSITTNPPLESPYVTSIHETAQGAIIAFNPTSINFGTVRAGRNSGPVQFSIENTGNLAANLTLTATTQNPSSNPNVFSVQTQNVTVSTTTNDQTTFTVPGNANFGTNYSGKIVPTANGTIVTCAPLPNQLTLTGKSN
jgi:hypothetical protein